MDRLMNDMETQMVQSMSGHCLVLLCSLLQFTAIGKYMDANENYMEPE